MSYSFRELYAADLHRYGNHRLKNRQKQFHYYMRRAQTEQKPLFKQYYRFRFIKMCEKLHTEISWSTEIDRGFYMGHPYGITINAKAKIGANVNVHKGVTIGQANRGARKGAPTIGNGVWIGINATVVGNVTIGDDVLIAPNSYVNCDIPSHSIVVGNPCVIKHREYATEHYINNTVD